MKINILLILLFGLMLSCVPRRQLIYLQNNNKTEEIYTYISEDYQLKPKDIIAVNIFSLTPGQFDIFGKSDNNQNTSVNSFTIDSNGYVELPAIGAVEVQNLTLKEAQDKIKTMLEDYLRSPLVRITLQTPFKFTVLGEVNQPGQYTKIEEEVTLLEALGTAGDLSRYADRSRIKIVRKNNKGFIQIAYVNVLQDSMLSSNYYHLQSEDIIIVDPLRARSARENQLFFITSTVGIITSISLLLSRFL